MDRLVKARRPLRMSFTKTYEAALTELSSAEPVEETVKLRLTKLERLSEELREKDEKILDLLIDEEDPEKYDTEYAVIEEYRDKLERARLQVGQFLNSLTNTNANNYEENPDSQRSLASSPTSSKRRLKLPKLELKKFSGEIKDWLNFWSQFKRIHESADIETEDKFEYLVQAMEVGTRARELVECFPPSAENYGKVIDSLKVRFGKDELLVEYYVRELLGLVIQNASSTNVRAKTHMLYDKLESHLRALESIGMTRDKYAAMLLPLVESCLPEEILRVWLRSPALQLPSSDESTNNSHSERLNQLLTFLRNEVEGEERISLARTGFSKTSEVHKRVKSKRDEAVDERVPSANDLFSGEKGATVSCIFCEKHHDGKNCLKARKMKLSEKLEILTKKKCCFLCFRVGHRSKRCRSNIRCLACAKRHPFVMCPELTFNRENKESTENVEVQPSTSLANPGCSQVLIQTLLVKIKGEGGERVVRALLDTGSQRSYILKRTAGVMRYEPSGSEALTHVLFGGVHQRKMVHQRYCIPVSSLKGNYSCVLQMLDQERICGSIPSLSRGPWLKELREKGIWLSDLEQSEREIELLIGSDMVGKLFAGRKENLKCGLVAMETYLGWVVMGKKTSEGSGGAHGDQSIAGTVTTLLIHNGDVSDLWRLDAIGILDPTEAKTRKEIEQSAVDHFLSTVKINEQGRYEVQLPWIEGHDVLSNNRVVAEKRLVTTTSKLIAKGKYNEYEAVFVDWLAEGIIEELPMEEVSDSGHYLPHRAVFKDNSTTPIRPVFDASCRLKDSPSLNDCLEKGPNLLEQIPAVLMRFREKAIGVISDIKKAFLQISVNEKDRDFLKFLWWEDFEKRRFRIFRHCRVVFGVNCSPFLLGAVVDYHLSKSPLAFRNSAEKLKSAFYVDNCVTSVDTEEELDHFIHDARFLLAQAKFDLRGWESTIQVQGMMDTTKADCEATSVLGLLWDRKSDMLYCDVSKIDCGDVITRRSILAIAHKVFDPIGFTSPTMLIPKFLLQESWQLKLKWDADVPQSIQCKFNSWVKELHLLSEAKIPSLIFVSI